MNPSIVSLEWNLCRLQRGEKKLFGHAQLKKLQIVTLPPSGAIHLWR